jgi:flagellin-like protein
MWIMGKRFNNRAVSQVIAALLLIAIAVAAAVLVYVFSIGLLGSLQGGGGQQVKQQLIMEAYDWASQSPTLLFTMRNVGTSALDIADVFVSGNAAGGFALSDVGTGSGCGVASLGAVPVQTACLVTITMPTTFTPTSGVAYAVKTVTSDGAVFSYSAIAGQAS